ncbi:MAG: Jag N-terminal domain-containing protein [Candidatus Krumholzibacteriota bacterium]|nr:Jag N-terminal domain-containing protein [Candidatus Krumholzibacteriota bacterium]
MKSIEASGRTKEEAVEQALGELGLQRSQAKVEVLEEGTRGFLGMGGRPFRVRVMALGEGGGDPAVVLRDLLEILGVDFQLESRQEEDGLRLRIISPRDDGMLIGRRGQTLDAIRHLTQRVVAAREGRNVVVNIDVGDYRERREERLRDRAREAVEQARETGRSVTMEPMSAQDRRVVHLVLADEEGLRTYTIGGGPRRRVVVAPEGKAAIADFHEGDYESEPASAYDGVPDPGFRPSRLTGDEDGDGRRRPDEERPRRQPRRRPSRDDDRPSVAGRRSQERPPAMETPPEVATGDRGEERPRSGDVSAAATVARRQREPRRDDRRRSREHRPEESRRDERRSGERPQADSPRGEHHRDERRSGERPRTERPHDEHRGDDRRRGGSRRDDHRRDGRHRDDHPYEDSGREEPAAVSLTEVPEVSDDSTEKPFSRDLARQVLKIGDNASDKPATTSRRRPRRR